MALKDIGEDEKSDWFQEDTAPAVPSRLLKKDPSFGPTKSRVAKEAPAQSRLQKPGGAAVRRSVDDALVLPETPKGKVSDGARPASAIPPLPDFGSGAEPRKTKDRAQGIPSQKAEESSKVMVDPELAAAAARASAAVSGEIGHSARKFQSAVDAKPAAKEQARPTTATGELDDTAAGKLEEAEKSDPADVAATDEMETGAAEGNEKAAVGDAAPATAPATAAPATATGELDDTAAGKLEEAEKSDPAGVAATDEVETGAAEGNEKAAVGDAAPATAVPATATGELGDQGAADKGAADKGDVWGDRDQADAEFSFEPEPEPEPELELEPANRRSKRFYALVLLVAAAVVVLGAVFLYQALDEYYKKEAPEPYHGGGATAADASTIALRKSSDGGAAQSSQRTGDRGLPDGQTATDVTSMAVEQDGGMADGVAAQPPGAADVEALVQQVSELIKKGKYKKAVSAIEKAPQQVRGLSQIKKLMADAYAKLSKEALDQSALKRVYTYGKKALALDPQRKDVWFYCGYSLKERGKSAQAKPYLKKYLQLCPKCQYSKWAKRYLER
jgi:tetratricopeptide (TPR) repeat protein